MSKSLIEKLDGEVERLMDSMLATELNSVDYKEKSQSVERLKKLSELLKGGATDRTQVDIIDVKEFLQRS